jgi:hypothetical protein
MKVPAVHQSALVYTRTFLHLEPLSLELIAAAARALSHEVRIIGTLVRSHNACFPGWSADATR